ncbi:MAG: nucleoside deaminase [Methylobacter sp.]|nr:nucleoside deaminase [Methylobacter sp.]
MNHEQYMHRAIELALQVPDLPFGAVIVNRNSGEIVAEGFNQSAINPIFHGEIVAINQCAQTHRSADWREFDLYTTAEPCSMCQSAIAWAGIDNVYYGTSIPYLQQQNWWQINIRAVDVMAQTPFRQGRVIGGVLEAECNALFDNSLKNKNTAAEQYQLKSAEGCNLTVTKR